ncbi:MAG: BlaI/MecI/CopY family transcriptional regulator, partial [Lachnospiraceae bacterium]|nr:BlaI/MecI/CopY family transcriptional regulator [Lachnospiraceae bacterium]
MAEEKKEWYSMTEAERKFADVIWENEPVGSGELVSLCNKRFGWKKSTTYTFLKKLCEQG